MLRESRWQTRPVFVTSTFRDMHAERDWLREHVIPELEERVRERRRHLEMIDLRWGVETVSVDEEHAKELVVLKVCLDEIERSRPFLIALLGDRYGWVPPAERMQAAVDEAGFETSVEGKSITALEIEFGVLDSPDQRRRTHFYFREPLPYDEMPPEVAAQYSDADDPELDQADKAQRSEALGELKARIERELHGRVHHYSAVWDAEEQEVVGLEEFGRQVLEDLWRDLAEEIPEVTEEEPTWRDEERWAFQEFVEFAARDFVGREEITADLLEFARSPDGEGQPWGACVTGPSGSGKSALLAHVYRQLLEDIDPDARRRSPGLLGRLLGKRGASEADLLVLCHYTGVTPRSQSVDSLLLRWIEELAEFLGEEMPVAEDAAADEVEEAFASLLGRGAQDTRVVVLLDALNQFEPTTRARHLTWLPGVWPHNARLIATAIPCSASDTLLERPGVRDMPLEPLPAPEAEEIARRICARYHRTPHPDLLAALTGKRRPDGSAAAGNPLWLTLAVEELNLLDQDDFERADREFTGSGDERLHQLLLSVVEELPPDVEGLYQWMLGHTEEVWGEPWARAFANLMALSRGGWRETDLRELLPTVTEEAWEPARFAGLRRSFRGHLVRRGAHGQWDFAHSQTRLAIERRNLGDPAEVRGLHSLTADHLEDLPSDDPLHEAELMLHLIGADDHARAARRYGSLLTDGEQKGATQRLAEPIIAGEGEDPNAGLGWALAIVEAEGVEDALIGRVCWNVIFYLRDAIENDTRLDTHRALLEPTRDALQRLLAADPGNVQWQRDLSVSQIKVGDVLVAQGDLSGALEA